MAEKKKLENEIQNEIFDYLLQANYFFWRSNNVPVFGKNNGGKYMYRKLPKHTPRGLPDIMLIHKGKAYGIEVKREGAKLSDEQANFGVRLVENGAEYIIARSVDDVRKHFTKDV